MKWGIDAYSRYKEVDGERYVIEPIPTHLYAPLSFRVAARAEIIHWHLGMIRQHGLAEWNRLRKL